MQSRYAGEFERDMGCTEAEWLGWLQIHWQAAAPRVLGQIRIPRLLVRFAFAGLDDHQRYVFMKRFDLYMQRGGG